MKKHIVLINTTRCNFRCKHCIRDYYEEQTDIPLPLVDTFMSEAREMGYQHVALTGGESALQPEFSELMDLLCEKHGMLWSVVTNGFDYEAYDYAVEKFKDQCRFIAVSFDGGTEQTHDHIRRNGSFKQALDALDYYKDRGIRTKIAFTLNSLNMEQIHALMNIGLEHKVDEIRFAAITPNTINHHLSITWEQKLRMKRVVDKLREQKLPFKITHTSSMYSVADPEHFCDNLNHPEPAVNPFGEYIFCCDTLGRGAVLGNLRDEKFSDLYIKQIKMATLLKEQRKALIEQQSFSPEFNSCTYCNQQCEQNQVQSRRNA